MDNPNWSEEEYLRSKGGSFELLIPKPHIVAGFLVAIALVSIHGVYTAYKSYQQVVTLKQGQVVAIDTTDSLYSAWKTYRNELDKFEFKYPPTWEITTWEQITAYPSLSLSPQNNKGVSIDMGGDSARCDALSESEVSRCRDTIIGPVFTASKDIEVLKILDLIVRSIASTAN